MSLIRCPSSFLPLLEYYHHVPQLRAMARELGLRGYSHMTKPRLGWRIRQCFAALRIYIFWRARRPQTGFVFPVQRNVKEETGVNRTHKDFTYKEENLQFFFPNP